MSQNKDCILFNRYDSRTGDHSYSGWTSGYDLAYNGRRYRVRERVGAIASGSSGGPGAQDLGEFDPAEIDDRSAYKVDVMKLGRYIQQELGIKVPVPDGKVLVTTRFAAMGQISGYSYYSVYTAGQEVEPTAMREDHLLAEGESVLVHSGHSDRSRKVRVTNIGGKPVESDGAAEEKKEFAQQQLAYLQELGFSQSRAYRIMKAGGPGAVKAAVEWVRECLKVLEANHPAGAYDALDDLLCGAGGTNSFGMDRQIGVFKALGLPLPKYYNSRSLFSVIAAAKEVVKAGLPREPSSESEAA